MLSITNYAKQHTLIHKHTRALSPPCTLHVLAKHTPTHRWQPVASCAMPVMNGMKVKTDSLLAKKARYHLFHASTTTPSLLPCVWNQYFPPNI